MGVAGRIRRKANNGLARVERAAKSARRFINSIPYEGATTSRRGNDWSPSRASADDLIAPSIDLLRARSRHMCRNHWAAKRAAAVLTAKIVGEGIMPSCRDSEEFDALLRIWSKRQTQVGAEKGQSLAGVQRIVARTVIESGSAIVLRRWRDRRQMVRRGLVMPFDVAVLEPEYLDCTKDGVRRINDDTRHLIVHGIEFDMTGWPVAYHLHTEHPSSSLRPASMGSVRIPAYDVSHVFWRERCGQTIGVPWFAAVLLKLKDFDDYEDAELLRQKIASTFVAFIRNDGMEDVEVEEDPLSLEPGRIQYLDIGEHVEFSNPPTVNGFGEYSNVTLRSIAAGVGLSFEDLSNNYSQVNFSSARMGAMVTNVLNDQWQAEMMIGMLCSDLERWAREGAVAMGIEDADATWTAPGRELIDPSREVGAIERKMAAGLTSRQAEIRKLGRDPVEVDEERKQDADREAQLELSSDDSTGSGMAIVREILTELRER